MTDSDVGQPSGNRSIFQAMISITPADLATKKRELLENAKSEFDRANSRLKEMIFVTDDGSALTVLLQTTGTNQSWPGRTLNGNLTRQMQWGPVTDTGSGPAIRWRQVVDRYKEGIRIHSAARAQLEIDRLSGPQQSGTQQNALQVQNAGAGASSSSDPDAGALPLAAAGAGPSHPGAFALAEPMDMDDLSTLDPAHVVDLMANDDELVTQMNRQADAIEMVRHAAELWGLPEGEALDEVMNALQRVRSAGAFRSASPLLRPENADDLAERLKALTEPMIRAIVDHHQQPDRHLLTTTSALLAFECALRRVVARDASSESACEILIVVCVPTGTTPLALARLEACHVAACFERVQRRARIVQDASLERLRERLLVDRPRMLHWVGHRIGGTLAFTDNRTGGVELNNPATISDIIGTCAKFDRLELAFINACQSNDHCHRLQTRWPHLTTVGWKTDLDDMAGYLFARGFYTALTNAFSRDTSSLDTSRSYQAGKDAVVANPPFVLRDPRAASSLDQPHERRAGVPHLEVPLGWLRRHREVIGLLLLAVIMAIVPVLVAMFLRSTPAPSVVAVLAGSRLPPPMHYEPAPATPTTTEKARKEQEEKVRREDEAQAEKAAEERAILKPDCSCMCEAPPSTASWHANVVGLDDPCDTTTGQAGDGCLADVKCTPFGCWPSRTAAMRDKLAAKIQRSGQWHGASGRDPWDSFEKDQRRRSDQQAEQRKQRKAVCPAAECRYGSGCMCIVADDHGNGYLMCDG
jgi:hypothetical protein